MMTSKPKNRDRGGIETLASGSLRVKVYAGTDALTGKRNDLTETVPLANDASAKDVKEAWKQAEKIRQGFIKQVNERRNPRTKATVNQMLDRMLDPKQTTLKWGRRTRKTNVGYINKHVRPFVGRFPIAELDADIFDPFYAELQRCRDHCDGKSFIQHRTDRPHDCDKRCQPHQCDPLAPATVNKIHNILSLGLKLAVRWKWLTISPIAQADPPDQPPPDPQPPTPADMARIINEAWETDLDFGFLVWMLARTGARRGESCAFRIDLFNVNDRVLDIRTNIATDGSDTYEKDIKNHLKRRAVLTQTDVDLYVAYMERRRKQAALLGMEVVPDGRIFSPAPDHSRWYTPDSISQRYDRLCKRLGINTSLHKIRTFTTTELIAAGADVRTVAGLVGHGGGGTTTLKVYSAFVNEAAQRAVNLTGQRMPALPDAARRTLTNEPAPAVPKEPSDAAYQRIAVDIAGAIRCGIATSGTRLPPMKTMAERYGVNVQTVHRAVALLKEDGLVAASRGVAATVI